MRKLGYIKINKILDLIVIKDILNYHDIERTKKLIIVYLVEEINKTNHELKKNKLCKFIEQMIGPILLKSTWTPYDSATSEEIEELNNAHCIVKSWFYKKSIELFFDICVQDSNRKNFWLQYVECMEDFYIIGSLSTKTSLENNKKVNPTILEHFHCTKSKIGQTSALILVFKNRVMVEFSDVGCLYVYSLNDYISRTILSKISDINSISKLKRTYADEIISFGMFNHEGKMPHITNWHSRLSWWMYHFIIQNRESKVIKCNKTYNIRHKLSTLWITPNIGIEYKDNAFYIYDSLKKESIFLLEYKDAKLLYDYMYLIGIENHIGWSGLKLACEGGFITKIIGYLKPTLNGIIFKEHLNNKI